MVARRCEPSQPSARCWAIPYDALLLLGAVPSFPAALQPLLASAGCAVALLGPRFARQDLVLLCRGESAVEVAATPLQEELLGRLLALVLAEGWLDRRRYGRSMRRRRRAIGRVSALPIYERSIAGWATSYVP